MFGAFLLFASGVRIQSFFVNVGGPLAAGFLNALNCERDVVLFLGVVSKSIPLQQGLVSLFSPIGSWAMGGRKARDNET